MSSLLRLGEEESGDKPVCYEITAKAAGMGFSLFVRSPISQTILYDPQTGTFELEVFEQLPDRPNLPQMVSRLVLTIRRRGAP